MLNVRKRIYGITVAALLCAIGILIPLVSPIKVVLEPASFTLASHVAIFIAMFISPLTAVFVTIGTTLGFFLAGFPPVVVARAASHIVFATVGSLMLARKPAIIDSFKKATAFSFIVSLIHGVCEVIVVLPFYFLNLMTSAYYDKGLFVSVILLVGVGTVVHSMVDFYIAYAVWRPIRKITGAGKAVVE
ncbi:MAG: hypothetical protein ACOYID_09230 [Eubacteriales bacterium]|jgi:niacin transporter|nr:hypothetical protein [Clostridiales bacterium]